MVLKQNSDNAYRMLSIGTFAQILKQANITLFSKVSKYGVYSGLYLAVFGLNTGKYGPEKNPYLDTFHALPE